MGGEGRLAGRLQAGPVGTRGAFRVVLIRFGSMRTVDISRLPSAPPSGPWLRLGGPPAPCRPQDWGSSLVSVGPGRGGWPLEGKLGGLNKLSSRGAAGLQASCSGLAPWLRWSLHAVVSWPAHPSSLAPEPGLQFPRPAEALFDRLSRSLRGALMSSLGKACPALAALWPCGVRLPL